MTEWVVVRRRPLSDLVEYWQRPFQGWSRGEWVRRVEDATHYSTKRAASRAADGRYAPGAHEYHAPAQTIEVEQVETL